MIVKVSLQWTLSGHGGTNLLQTAAHEFGHSLGIDISIFIYNYIYRHRLQLQLDMNMRRPGLSHSDQHSALMAPFYRGFQAGLSLDTDDITAVQVSHPPLCLGDTSPIIGYFILLVQALYGTGQAEDIGGADINNSLGSLGGGAARARGGKSVDNKELCRDTASIDAVLATEDGDTFVFKGGAETHSTSTLQLATNLREV